MASWDHQLLAAVIRADAPSKKFEEAERQGITHKTFGRLEVRTAWARIKTHYERLNNYGHVPSEQMLLEWYPKLELPEPAENFKDLCQKVKENHLKGRLDKYLTEAIQEMGDDPMDVVTKLYERVGQLQELGAKSHDRSSDRSALEEEAIAYKKRQETGGVTGLPFPWVQMSQDTRGMNAGDYILVWAMPKSMKTWFGLMCAAHLVKCGYRVLIYSKEMQWPQIRRRMYCLLAGVNYEKLLDASLSAEEERHYFDVIEGLAKAKDDGLRKGFVFTDADKIDGTSGGPADIRRKMEIYQPDFVLLDSSYMLTLPGVSDDKSYDWKVLAIINKQIKQICKSTKIPTMAILQENEQQAYKYKKSRGTAALAMNKSAVQDCDLGIKLVLNNKREELSIKYAVGREMKAAGFTINAVLCENLSFAGRHLHDVGDEFEEEDDEAAVPKEPQKERKRASMREAFRANKAPTADPIEDEIGKDLDNDLEQ